MAEHGYAREYDEPIGRGDDERDRRRDEDRDQRSHDSNRDPNERNVNFMLGDRERRWEGRSDRGRESVPGFREFGSDPRSAFHSEDRQYRGGDWERSPRNFRSNQDDHYRSWRNRQMEALDRDYADYCREREQQFHRDFDDWRQNRRNRPSADESVAAEAEREMSHSRAIAGEGNTPSAVGAATLGTNNSENSGTGRAKPSA